MAGGEVAFYIDIYHNDFGRFSQKTGLQANPENRKEYNLVKAEAVACKLAGIDRWTLLNWLKRGERERDEVVVIGSIVISENDTQKLAKQLLTLYCNLLKVLDDENQSTLIERFFPIISESLFICPIYEIFTSQNRSSQKKGACFYFEHHQTKSIFQGEFSAVFPPQP